MSEQNAVRINKFDNLKGLAIFCVVLGHMAFLTKYASIDFIHHFVLIIHLPIFFFVAGYFTKIDENLIIKSVKRILIPYILFSILYWAVYLPFGRPSKLIFIYPTYALWFLLALFFMKIALPIMDRFKYPVLISLVFALLFGLVNLNGDLLALSRAFAFFPVFLIGHYYKDYMKRIGEKHIKFNNLLSNNLFKMLVSFIILLITLLAAYYLPITVIMMKVPFKHPYLLSASLRLLVILVGILFTLVLNGHMTNKEYFFTKWGRNSMVIYIVHIYFIVILKKFAKGFLYQQNEIVALLMTFLITLLIVILLSRDRFTDYFNHITDAFSNLILKKD